MTPDALEELVGRLRNNVKRSTTPWAIDGWNEAADALEAEHARTEKAEAGWKTASELLDAAVGDYNTEHDRAEALQARVRELEAGMLPFARADRAIGSELGPFRFETGTGYRELSREDFQQAGALLTPSEPHHG